MRLRIGFLLVSMVVSVFAVRLFQLQGVDAQAYVAKARAEGVVTVDLPATRG
jgi:cell division protein FtsI (penicillin-binding protein 3)